MEHVLKTGRTPSFLPEHVQKPLAFELLPFTGRWRRERFSFIRTWVPMKRESKQIPAPAYTQAHHRFSF